MNVKRFVCCLLASVLLLGVSLISCGNSSRAKAKNEIAQSGEDFKSFVPGHHSSTLIAINQHITYFTFTNIAMWFTYWFTSTM